jgi:hypothetical protein
MLKNGPSVDQSGGNQGQTRLRSKTLANGEVKPEVEGDPEEAAGEQNKVPEAKRKTRTEARTISWQPQNQTVRFPKSDHPISTTLGQKGPSRNTAPRIALALIGVL